MRIDLLASNPPAPELAAAVRRGDAFQVRRPPRTAARLGSAVPRGRRGEQSHVRAHGNQKGTKVVCLGIARESRQSQDRVIVGIGVPRHQESAPRGCLDRVELAVNFDVQFAPISGELNEAGNRVLAFGAFLGLPAHDIERLKALPALVRADVHFSENDESLGLLKVDVVIWHLTRMTHLAR